MDRVKAARVFIAIVEQGSLVKAAEKMNMSRSMVTRYLSEMEHWAQSQLLLRSTRKLSLTAAGEKVLNQCYQLERIDQEVKYTSSKSDIEPSGTIRVGASQFMAEKILTPFISTFLAKYSKVNIDIQVSNHTADLVAERLDLAIRITNDLDPNVIAKKFGVLNSVVCASPEYLKNSGVPQKLSQLAHHNCLTYSFFVNNLWNFSKGEESYSVSVQGNLSANDPSVLLNATLLATGISLLPKHAVKEHLDTGELIAALPEFTPQTLGIFGVYKSRKYMSKALRNFIDEFSVYLISLEI